LIAPALPSSIRPDPTPAGDSDIAELVDITPHVSLLSKVGQSGHSVAEAVAELVDNSLDARFSDQSVQVDVTYNVREGWLRIEDDGYGMSRTELAAALVLAHSEKGAAKIGKFGLGMKTACTSLGEQFEIWTVEPSGKMATVATYDETQFLVANEWKLPIARRRKHRDHGTTITIQCSRLYGSLQQTLLRNLGWTFRHFLLDDWLRLRVNGVVVAPATYDVNPQSVMPFEGVVAGKTVTGWAGLLHKSSQRGWYGFGLVRHRRIIRRHEKLGFQAHPQTARVVGEIHLDGFDTNNLKTDFIRETPAWRELEEWISGVIEPILAQSRALAHAGMLDLKIKAKIDEERRRVLEGPEGHALNLPDGSALARQGSDSRPVAVAVGSLHLEHVFAEGAVDDPYVEVRRITRAREADLIMVRTNLAHPAASQIADRSGWACHNLAEVAARELGAAQEFVTTKSIVLAKLLTERALRRALTEAARDLLRPEPGHTVITDSFVAS
jgi:hypothetical protein